MKNLTNNYFQRCGYNTLIELQADESRLNYEDELDKAIKAKLQNETDPLKIKQLEEEYKTNFPKDCYWPIKDPKRGVVYIPVSFKRYSELRNQKREELRLKDRESRCCIPSNLFKGKDGKWEIRINKNTKNEFKKCMEDCNKCPYTYRPEYKDNSVDYIRTGNMLSLNTIIEGKDGKDEEHLDCIQDNNIKDPFQKTMIEHKKSYFIELMKTYDSNKSFIILARMVNQLKNYISYEDMLEINSKAPAENLNFKEIALILNKPESTVKDWYYSVLEEILRKIKEIFE